MASTNYFDNLGAFIAFYRIKLTSSGKLFYIKLKEYEKNAAKTNLLSHLSGQSSVVSGISESFEMI